MKGTGLQMHTASMLIVYFWWCMGGRKVSSLTGKCCQLFASTVCSVIKESRILNLAKLFVGVSTHWETSSLCECRTWSDNIAEILVTKDVQLDVLTELLFLQLERVFECLFLPLPSVALQLKLLNTTPERLCIHWLDIILKAATLLFVLTIFWGALLVW